MFNLDLTAPLEDSWLYQNICATVIFLSQMMGGSSLHARLSSPHICMGQLSLLGFYIFVSFL